MNYQEEYIEFMKNYKLGQTSAEQIGEMICRLAQYYGMENISLGIKTKNYDEKTAGIVQRNDEMTDKPMAVGKAEIIAKATEEAALYDESRRRLQNIEQYINALKALQKGVLNEYSHIGG
jgi:hypothetical protein